MRVSDRTGHTAPAVADARLLRERDPGRRGRETGVVVRLHDHIQRRAGAARGDHMQRGVHLLACRDRPKFAPGADRRCGARHVRRVDQSTTNEHPGRCASDLRHSQLTNTALLMEEVGEVARLMARIYGEQSFKNPADALTAKEDLADEMADVLFVLICLANQTGVNLEEALKRNLEKKTSRDLTRHQDNEKLR